MSQSTNFLVQNVCEELHNAAEWINGMLGSSDREQDHIEKMLMAIDTAVDLLKTHVADEDNQLPPPPAEIILDDDNSYELKSITRLNGDIFYYVFYKGEKLDGSAKYGGNIHTDNLDTINQYKQESIDFLTKVKKTKHTADIWTTVK